MKCIANVKERSDGLCVTTSNAKLRTLVSMLYGILYSQTKVFRHLLSARNTKKTFYVFLYPYGTMKISKRFSRFANAN